MLCNVLRQLNKSGVLPIDTLGDILSIADPYPYLSHRDMRYSQVRTLFRASGKEEVQLQILQNLVQGTGWICAHVEADADINGDGAVDTSDLLDGGIKANDELARLLTMTREEQKHGMKSIGSERAARLHCSIDKSIQTLLAIRQAVGFLEQRQTRKSA
jgi:hypothetical protein